VREGERTRKVVLPPGRWYQSDTGRWVSGGRNLTARKAKDTTPLFVRDGALLPMQRGIPIDNRKDLTSIELWAFLTARTRGKSVLRYAFDDGETFDYRKGRRSDYELTARVSGRDLYISVDARQEGFGALDFTPFTVERFRSVVVTRGGERVVLKPTAVASDLFGAKAHFFRYG
jgi:alpha-glucosidase (family GH31 glycosyl hydrolase)